jgi:hypothetical protein
MARLKVYRGGKHPHIRQLPFPITLPEPDLEEKLAAEVLAATNVLMTYDVDGVSVGCRGRSWL